MHTKGGRNSAVSYANSSMNNVPPIHFLWESSHFIVHMKSILITGLFFFIMTQYTILAQEEFIDDMFLDDSFTDEKKEENNTAFFENNEDLVEYEPTPSTKTSSTLLGFSVEERFSYSPIQRNSVSLNENMLLFVPKLKNTMMLSNFAQYRNAERWFKLFVDYRLFLEIEDKEWNSKNDIFDIKTFLGFELNEAYMDFTIAELFTIKIGKSQFRIGSAFLINPSNPLTVRPGAFAAWTRQLRIPDYYSDREFPEYDFPNGSKEEIGVWQFSTSIVFPLLFFEIAYLPKMNSGFREFDRPSHSFVSKISYTQWYFFVPTLVYFYDDSSFIGLDTSATLNDDITIHTELGISFKNELRRIRDNGQISHTPKQSVNTYTIQQEQKEGVFLEAIAGIQYTLTVDSVSLFTILFESYFNGKGLYNDDWYSYLEDLSSLHKDRANKSNPFVPAYTGLVGKALRLYDPLRVRPLYLLLRLSRDDVFSQFSAQKFNIKSSLIYSPFDTSFLWINYFEWEAVELLTLGIELQYNFGLEGGAFTELNDVFALQIYSKISF